MCRLKANTHLNQQKHLIERSGSSSKPGLLGNTGDNLASRTRSSNSRLRLDWNFSFSRLSPTRFFHMQPKYPNGAIFVNTEGLRPCFSLSKPSYGATQWGLGFLMARLLQEERLKSPQKLLFRNPGLLGHFCHFGKTGHFGRFGRQILSQDGRPEENFHLGSGSDQRDRTNSGIRHVGRFARTRSKTATWGG